jgi:hypothetical protein
MKKVNPQSLGLCVASAVFGLMSVAHLVRLVTHPEVIVAGHQFPLWASALAVLILGGLSLWMWKLARPQTQ